MIDWNIEGKRPADKWSLNKQVKVKCILNQLDFDSVLEIGCGNGEFSNILLEYTNNIHGIDKSPDRIESSPINAECIDFMDIPENQKFDLVCCSHVLVHIDNDSIEKFYDKMKRLSKKYVLIIEPDITQYDTLEWQSGNYPYDYESFDEFISEDVDIKTKAFLTHTS